MTHDEFDAWFTRVLRSLYPNRDAGFAIVITAFPPLERYLRQKTGVAAGNIRDPRFCEALFGIFPELKSPENAKQFWRFIAMGCSINARSTRSTAKAKGWPTAS